MLLLLTTLLLGAFLIWWILTPEKRLRDMGNKIPGPRTFPIFGTIFNFQIFGIKAVSDWRNAMNKYGNTFRFWIGPQLHIFISEPEDFKMILSSHTLITKSQTYDVLISWLGTGLLTSTGDLWQKRRKAITPTFHFKILEEFVPIFNKCAKTLVDVFKTKNGKDFFTVTDYMSNAALDAVAETAMGTELKAQTNPLGEYPKSIFKMTNALSAKAGNPLLGMEPIYTITGRKRMEEDLLKKLFDLPMKIIRNKENSKVAQVNDCEPSEEEAFGAKKRTAFLDLLIKMKQENAPAFETDKDIKDEVITFMFEGHDTTTMSLSYTLWLLGQNQDIQETLYNEISSILVSQEPSMEDYQKLTYLERVVKESLRLYPSVPVIARIAIQDIVLPSSGYTIPAGAQLDMVFLVTHRMNQYFPDPQKFNPDRFLEPQKHPYCYLPFSAGPRNCIGQKFAMLDLKVLISNVVLNYKIESDPDLILSPEMLLRSVKGPDIRLIRRD